MTEDAFARRFYADRAELDSLGIHLTVDKPADGLSEQENYSLAPEAFHLPPIEFTDAELAALQTALSLLDGEFAYAEPLRLALQQIAWGRPSPLDTPAQRVDRPRHHRRRPAAPSCPAAWPRSTRRSTAASGSSSSTTRCSAARRRRARSTRTCCCSRAASSTSSATRTSAARCACSGSRASAARSPTRPRPSTTSSAPPDFDPREYANRIPWQLGDPLGTAEIWVSEHIAWQVERYFGAYGEIEREDGAASTAPSTRSRACWSPGCSASASTRVARAARARREARERVARSPSCTPASRRRRRVDGSPPGAGASEETDGRSAAAARGRDPPRALRPAGDAGVGADRGGARGRAAAGRRRLRRSCRSPAGAARGRLGPQRRQLRRRRLRALRRGAPERRDRGRPRALLRHLRAPGAAAAHRGARRCSRRSS